MAGVMIVLASGGEQEQADATAGTVRGRDRRAGALAAVEQRSSTTTGYPYRTGEIRGV